MIGSGTCLAALVALGTAVRESPVHRAGADSLPPSRLAVHVDGTWREWWRADGAPVRWEGPDEELVQALRWRSVAKGIEWAEARLSGNGEAWRLKLVVVRLDPSRVRFRLDTAFTAGRARPAWSIDRTAGDVLFAVNAGQFPRAMPWGWVAIDGREFLAPGRGPLSLGVAFDSSGSLRWIPGDSLLAPATRRGAVTGFQSYPMLLRDGVIPEPLRRAGRGIDVSHRDARLAIGQDRHGSVLVAMTRFDGVGGTLDFVPFGLTTPEMAAVMGALGARNAVMLDGGISSQMLIRDPGGDRRWEGLRKVPLGLVVTGSGLP